MQKMIFLLKGKCCVVDVVRGRHCGNNLNGLGYNLFCDAFPNPTMLVVFFDMMTMLYC